MKQVKKRIWKRMWARKYSPFISSAFMYALRKKPGLNVSRNKLFVPEGNLHALYLDGKELNIIVRNYAESLSRQNMKRYAVWYEKQFKNFLLWTRKMTKRDFADFTKKQLADMVSMLFKRLIDFTELQFFAFLVLEGPVKELEGKLAQRADMLQAITTLYRHTIITKARIELLKLIDQEKTSDEVLMKYTKKYAWMSIYAFDDKPLSLSEIRDQVAAIKDAAAELRSIDEHQRIGLRKYRVYIKSIRDKKMKQLVEIVHHSSYLKEMRDGYRRHAYYLWIPFLEEVGKRIGLDIDGVNFLIAPEIVKALLKGKDFRNVAEARRRRYAHWFRDGKLSVYAEDEVSMVEGLLHKKKKVSEIKGFAASKGKANGKVNIVYHSGEFSKFKEGDILVTTMTHPEFLFLMKKAVAIITDEGGITCHAAIVSRELGRPCIIGTTNATQELKDGQLVEVDANKGVVKILSK